MDEILKIWEPLFRKYIDNYDMSPFMVYMIDLVDPSALSYLAEQFNVSGNRGWNLATTVELQRELIKNAMFTQRHEGTTWAIRNALKSIGYSNVEIQERVGIKYDGTYKHDGSEIYSSNTWVNFGVTIRVDNVNSLTDDQKSLILLMINEYKRATSILSYLRFENI